MKKHEHLSEPQALVEPAEDDLPGEVALLKAELRKARLNITLLNNVIDIASEELGVDIRKKSGTRRS